MKFKSIISTITLLCLLFWQAAYTIKNFFGSIQARRIQRPNIATGFKILGAKNAQKHP